MKESQEKIVKLAAEAERRLGHIEACVTDLDVLTSSEAQFNMRAAVRYFGDVMENVQTLGADIAQLAFDHGITKKAIAEAWDIPASTFAGMKKRV